VVGGVLKGGLGVGARDQGSGTIQHVADI
jgi:hypothetical protein